MADQDEVMAFLGDGANCGLAGSKVERIDTHISSVFLVGNRAFKLKRAVSLPFLDFSSLGLREKFCRKEITVNRRSAPMLYGMATARWWIG
jgi:aminoglycoside phosphotransferase family enzyme